MRSSERIDDETVGEPFKVVILPPLHKVNVVSNPRTGQTFFRTHPENASGKTMAFEDQPTWLDFCRYMAVLAGYRGWPRK